MLDIVIVSYRCRNLLRDCLVSLRRVEGAPEHQIHVIDNDSRDGTVEMVAQEFPEVRLTASTCNLGFARATNTGIRAGSAPYVLALNPDTRVPTGALEHLIGLMERRPEVGVCGPRLEKEDGTLDHASRRSFPTIVSLLGHFSGIGRRRDAGRRAALDEVGLFDKGCWMCMEDLDLCYRFPRAGWSTWYELAVTVTHKKSGSAGARRAPRLNLALHYGMYRYYRAHYAATRYPLINAVYCGIAAKLSASVVANALARAG